MELIKRKKLEITVEAPLLSRVEELLARAGVRGHTVVPVLAGKGETGVWQEGLLTRAEQMVLVYAITSEQTAHTVLEGLKDILKTWSGVVCMSDVEVIRGERF